MVLEIFKMAVVLKRFVCKLKRTIVTRIITTVPIETHKVLIEQ